MAGNVRRHLYGAVACLGAIPALAAAAPGADVVARGAYLAKAGDCAGCHTKPGQPLFSGGDYIVTRFGRIAPPNISPDPQYGIGTWSDDDFYRALHEGVRKDGAHLYPGMPYVWYTKVTRDDVLAIKAYLFSLPPAHQPDNTNHLLFPFNIREGIAGWNALYFKEGTFKPDASKSAAWNRGAYLVQGLAHCSACHTPTNVAMAPITDEAFAGGKVDDWYAPNITSDPKQGIGNWSQSDIVTYLKTGALAGKGVAIGPMKAVHRSLAALTDQDLQAIATYVKTIPAKTTYKNPTQQSQGAYDAGADVYLTNCAACHQPNGQGLAKAVPPLVGNGTVTAKGPQDVVRAVIAGLPAQDTYASMPGFAAILTPAQIADVANYVRGSWGNNAPATATVQMVSELSPKSDSMIAGTHWCEKPADTKLGHFVSDPSGTVHAALAQTNEVNELPQINKILADVRRAVPDANGADVVNQLTTAYCPVVFKDGAVPKAQRGPRLDEFAELVYTQLHVTQ